MSNETAPVVVVGATGGQGGAVLDALLDAGRPVRAIARDPSSGRATKLADRGVALATGDMVASRRCQYLMVANTVVSPVVSTRL